MKIYLVRIRKREGTGTLYLERKPDATTDDEYIAISHVWGDPKTVQETEIDGAGAVMLSPLKRDILSILQRRNICGKGWFWMDLFCIDQSPHAEISISDQLKSIPAIYKSSQIVKVLIETPVCTSWQEMAARAGDNPETDMNVFYEEELRHSRRCPNMSFSDPWFDRLWTRQEGLYAMNIDFITINEVPCVRLGTIMAAGDRWAAQGVFLGKRALVHEFIADKLAYHGLPRSKSDIILRVHFDLLYRKRLRMFNYADSPGPHEGYSPFSEVWRSGRQTTKPRDYVLAIFPDIEGYRVPENARKMKFKTLLLDAIQQVTAHNERRLSFIPKVPMGMMLAACASDCAKPWVFEEPTNVTEAYDPLHGISRSHAIVESEACKVRSVVPSVMQSDIEPINFNRDALPDLLSLWESNADTIKHATFSDPSGPCVRILSTYKKADVLYRYLSHEFTRLAIEKYAANPDLRPHGVVDLEKLNMPEDEFQREFRRFLACLVCGTTLRTSDTVLEAADFRLIPSPYGKLIALINKGFLSGDNQSFMLVTTGQTEFHGLQVAVKSEKTGFCHIVGKTMIPLAEVDSDESTARLDLLIAEGYKGSLGAS